jgi:hypothetical protein
MRYDCEGDGIGRGPVVTRRDVKRNGTIRRDSFGSADCGERRTLHRATWEVACYMYREGRISPYEWRAYQLASWSAHRFTGDAGRAQDRYATRCGMEALWRRRDRAKAMWARFCGVTLNERTNDNV